MATTLVGREFLVYPVQTRFGTEEWFIESSQKFDPETGLPAIVGQFASCDEALKSSIGRSETCDYGCCSNVATETVSNYSPQWELAEVRCVCEHHARVLIRTTN